ncbi:MAG: YggT family protein [Roseiflexaceae bacterium]|nr:YggT family protein [Roseiflexaceae bacterium]
MIDRERIIREESAETPERVIHEEVVATPVRTTVASVEHSTTRIPGDRERRLASLRRNQRIIYFIATAIAVLILLRFTLLALGANAENAFANLVYGLSGLFVAPFTTLFGQPTFGNSVFEISSLIAIAVYYLLAWGIIKIVTLTTAPPDATGRSYE